MSGIKIGGESLIIGNFRSRKSNLFNPKVTKVLNKEEIKPILKPETKDEYKARKFSCENYSYEVNK